MPQLVEAMTLTPTLIHFTSHHSRFVPESANNHEARRGVRDPSHQRQLRRRLRRGHPRLTRMARLETG